ncbi:hypothetical protein Plhal304r1_c029g0095131 [Plasmopara halstedii]
MWICGICGYDRPHCIEPHCNGPRCIESFRVNAKSNLRTTNISCRVQKFLVFHMGLLNSYKTSIHTGQSKSFAVDSEMS